MVDIEPIFVQKDSTCFPNYIKLNHHKLIKGVKQVQNNITTILLGIQDVEVTGATKKTFYNNNVCHSRAAMSPL